ncbi:hypothetical protein LXM50_14150 [Microbacterium sp. Au-Mic1]|uniref:hypothetical protein n=1 Tax=Microbacterium sp. Au-Mic1 TaxID=2906457 RepID=UPI001E2AE4BC|nr:hypothetical protein [Microbacterium sp. Au-Mic1]MCE4027118.1 hypothetical protein [Microbacterium sp. Au-Mic1]
MGSFAGTKEFGRLLFDQQAQIGMIFLRGHLVIEQAMTTIIELQGARTKVLLERASFSTKLNLCDGFGLLDEHLVTAIRLVNRERNHLAHRLDAIVTDERLAVLLSKLPARIRKAVDDVVSVGIEERAAEAERWNEQARERGLGEERLRKISFPTVRDVQPADTMQGLFLVLLMGLGTVVQKLRFEAEHGEKLEIYKQACAVAEVMETGATPESIRAHLELPDPPDPRHALGALFAPMPVQKDGA